MNASYNITQMSSHKPTVSNVLGEHGGVLEKRSVCDDVGKTHHFTQLNSPEMVDRNYSSIQYVLIYVVCVSLCSRGPQ